MTLGPHIDGPQALILLVRAYRVPLLVCVGAWLVVIGLLWRWWA